jgi:hypothetical protein
MKKILLRAFVIAVLVVNLLGWLVGVWQSGGFRGFQSG